MRVLSLILLLAAASAVVAAAASASQVVGRDARNIDLATDDRGRALITFTDAAGTHEVVAAGAVDARHPSRATPQVQFRLEYSGASGFRNTCRRYDGPALAWAVAACTASDGTYWALQRWQRMLPNLGYAPWKPEQRAQELHLSHWTKSGGVALLEVNVDWVYAGRFHSLFGRATYQGRAVHGFRSTTTGSPLDTYGRNVYLDTFGSAYGAGWHRENSFLAHNPSGMFCYGFYPRAGYPGYPAQRRMKMVGVGRRYRLTMIGPGVTPDVMWTGNGLQDFDRSNPALVEWDRLMNEKLDAMRASYGDTQCTHH